MSKSAFPHWIYDGSPIPDPFGYGQKAVDFIRALKHPKSSAPKGRFQLYDWQERIIRRIYGPCDTDGERLVREVFLYLPRGNRKTSLTAALALLHLLGPEAVPAGQIIFAAGDREQAGIGFDEALGIVEADKRLLAVTKVHNPRVGIREIKSHIDGSTLKAVSSDGKAQHGTTPSFVLADEIHIWKNRDLWEALQSGMAKRKGGLTVVATTAGRGNEGLAAERYAYARLVASGEVDKPAFLPVMFEIEPDEDWEDEAIWHRVNPGLKYGFHDIKKLRSDADEARSNPSKRYEFQQYHLNRWLGNSRDPLFDMTVYDAGSDPNFDLADLEGLPCWLGVDLSRSGDLTAVVGAWRHDDGRVSVHPWFFLPSDGLEDKAKVEQVPYPRWRDDGLLDVIDGPVIEPDAIADKIIDLCGTYDVREVVFDPSLAGPIMAKLMDHGINVLQVRQTPVNMHGPICDLERVVNGRRIRHGAHPILRNHFDSVVVKRAANAGELVTMHKGTRHSNHIDGAIASALAVSRAVAGEQSGSFLDTADFDSLWNEAV